METNVVFIVVDALRAGNLGCYGYSKPTSPNIDMLAKNGVLFENAFSCNVVTDSSLTTIFSGKYPRSHGIMSHGTRVSREEIQRFYQSGTCLLPEIMKFNGYTTLAVDWLGRWHRRGYDFYTGITKSPKRGLLHKFARACMRALYKTTKTKMLARQYTTGVVLRPLARLAFKPMIVENARMVTDRAMNLLELARDKIFFLFVHYWDTHYPYNPPLSYFNRFKHSNYGDSQNLQQILSQFDPEHLTNMRKMVDNWVFRGGFGDGATTHDVLAKYDGAISFVDHEIGRLIAKLKSFGILDQTFVILTSDHGESLTEHGIYFAHHGLYDVTIHVPLIFRFPELREGQRIRSIVQHTDIVPTILELLGARHESLVFDGKSTLECINETGREIRLAAYVEEVMTERKRAIRTSEYKYICASSGKEAFCRYCGRVHGGLEELYDLKKDPEENLNIIQKSAKQAKALRKRLDLELERMGKKKHEIKQLRSRYEEADQREIYDRLKKLGYI